MLSPIRVALISSVVPEDTSGGELILYRHINEERQLAVTVVNGKPVVRNAACKGRFILERVRNTKFSKYVEDLDVILQGHWLGKMCAVLNPADFDLVLTVAHGDGFYAAQRFAKTSGLPLVSIFHDWWPDIPDVHGCIRRKLENHFLELARESARVLCVSDGMKAALGNLENASVLYPKPGSRMAVGISYEKKTTEVIRIAYMGNLYDYGPMLQEAIVASWKFPSLKFEVRGKNPNWEDSFKNEARTKGNWLDFIKGERLQNWLNSVDAFLVAMDFHPKMRRRMETSFPSKLSEFFQYGKPIIVWGPHYCSAVKWAGCLKGALVCTNPSPLDWIASLAKKGLPEYTNGLSNTILSVKAKADFDPQILQQQFLDELGETLSN
jgi:hypothetical protein